MCFCDYRMHVRPYLIKYAFLNHSISTYQHLIHLPFPHHCCTHAVSDERNRDFILNQFPGSEPRTLIQRSRLACDHFYPLPSLYCGSYYSQRRSPIHTCEPTGIAMRQHDIAVFQKRTSIFPNLPVHRNILFGDPFRLFQRIAAHLLHASSTHRCLPRPINTVREIYSSGSCFFKLLHLSLKLRFVLLLHTC